MKNIVKDALILTAITVAAGVGLGLVYNVTKEPIRAAEEAATLAAYEALFPEAAEYSDVEDFDGELAMDYFEGDLRSAIGSDWPTGSVVVKNAVEALDSEGNVSGYIVTVTNKKSYGGALTLNCGITNEDNIKGYVITDISDTPGLGMKATEEGFMSRFRDIPAGIYTVVKNGAVDGQINAMSGATVTSKAVTNAVNAAVKTVDFIKNPPAIEELVENVEEAIVEGEAAESPVEPAPAEAAPEAAPVEGGEPLGE